ncbi:MAG: hypothetical protein LV473_22885 [Nitrospira sp.]|nr:hypothetical protein [Nitrospira sp.]
MSRALKDAASGSNGLLHIQPHLEGSHAHTRRDLLRASAGAAARVALSLLPFSIRRTLAIDANNVTKTIKDVQHVVILMLENRSFDHNFATLKGVRGFGDRFPIPLASSKPVWYESGGTREVTPFHLDQKRMNALKVDATSHECADTQAAWNQGKFGFWPKFKIDMMTGKAPVTPWVTIPARSCPFGMPWRNHSPCATTTIHWVVLSGTDPNRVFFFSGANHDPARRVKGLNATPDTSEPNNLRCWIEGAWPPPGYSYLGSGFDWPTIPEVLQHAGISWRICQDPNDNWTGAIHGCLAFNSFRNAKKGPPSMSRVCAIGRWTTSGTM